MLQKPKVFFLKLLFIIFIIYFFILVILFFFQRNLLYHPAENNYYGDKLTVSVYKVKIKTKDNIELLGWYHKKDSNSYKTILFLHGNTGSLENRIHKINHFKNMNVNFLAKLDEAREYAGIPFIINSAYRSPTHPESIKNPTSSHIKGLAVDISVKDSRTRFLVLDALLVVGFSRVGISNSFIKVIEGCAHNSHMEKPSLINQSISDFLV